MPADEFVGMASSPHVLGDPRLRTMHHVGVTKWEKTSDTEITGYSQMRVAHQKYADDNMTEVATKEHAHGKGTMWYRRVDGVWKFAGIEPDIRWTEHKRDQVFEEGAKEFGEKKSED